jgi:hypothetical protein
MGQIKIPVQYIEHKNYVFVRKVKPEVPHGAKALKNESFKDEEYWPTAYAYSKQVTTKLINERYRGWQKALDERSEKDRKLLQEKVDLEVEFYGYSPIVEQQKRQSKIHNYYVSYENTERLDQYKLQIRYKNYEIKDMFVELTFYGPLNYPQVANNTTEAFIALNCIIPQQHNIMVDMYSQEVTGNSLLKYIEGSTFWVLPPGDNEIELSARDPIKEGNVRIQTRYELKT